MTFSAAVSHIIPGPYLGYWNSSMSEVISFWFVFGLSAFMIALNSDMFLMRWAAKSAGSSSTGHAPELLVVGLEEVVVEPPAEAGDDPALERVGVLRRTDARPAVGKHAADGLDDPEVAQRVRRLQRVVVELAAVEDAAHPRPHQEVLVRQDLVPERLDLGHLGEEPVAADVEAPALALGGAADAADHRVALDDGDGHLALHQLECGGETGRTCSDHDYLRLVGHDSTTTFPFRPTRSAVTA